MIGETLGQYQITEHLGHGGMAEVYKAYQSRLDRYVAVKALHTSLASDENFLTRFRREAKAVAALRHPNIVQVYDFDYDEKWNLYYMVMEFIDGPTLKERLVERAKRGERVPLDETIRIVMAIGRALDYAHRRGMIHRDVKPANIMFNSEGQVILTDFGIAKMVDMRSLTASGAMVGTPAYTSPELAEGESTDVRSDIYSLGVVLYELVTGCLPFEADTPIGIVLKHIRDPVPSPRIAQPDLPIGLELVITRALAKDPDHRYKTAAAFVKALQRATNQDEELTGEATEITPTDDWGSTPPPTASREASSPSSRPANGPRRRWAIWTLAALGGILLLLAGAAGVLLTNGLLDDYLRSLGLLTAVEATPTPDLDATYAAGTAVSQAAMATTTPTPTSTSTPTPRLARTVAASDMTATALAACDFAIEVARDHIVWPRILMPGQAFNKRWELKNAGSCSLPEGVELTFVSGDEAEVVEKPTIEPLPVGEATEVALTLRAPREYGTYVSVWRLRDAAGNGIGPRLEVAYEVGATPTPATPTPSSREQLWMSRPRLAWCNGSKTQGEVIWNRGGGPDDNYRYFYSQVSLNYELPMPSNTFADFPHIMTYFTTSGTLTFPIPEACGKDNRGHCGSPEDGYEIVWEKVYFSSENCPE